MIVNFSRDKNKQVETEILESAETVKQRFSRFCIDLQENPNLLQLPSNWVGEIFINHLFPCIRWRLWNRELEPTKEVVMSTDMTLRVSAIFFYN